MIERLAFLFIASLIGYVIFQTYRQWQIRRLTHNKDADPILLGLQKGIPAIIYFTTPYCIPCKTIQQPALLQLQNEMGTQIQIIQIDAMQQPDAADRWGVLSAPTTFVLDNTHKPNAINHGAVNAEQLKQQLLRASA